MNLNKMVGLGNYPDWLLIGHYFTNKYIVVPEPSRSGFLSFLICSHLSCLVGDAFS